MIAMKITLCHCERSEAIPLPPPPRLLRLSASRKDSNESLFSSFVVPMAIGMIDSDGALATEESSPDNKQRFFACGSEWHWCTCVTGRAARRRAALPTSINSGQSCLRVICGSTRRGSVTEPLHERYSYYLFSYPIVAITPVNFCYRTHGLRSGGSFEICPYPSNLRAL